MRERERGGGGGEERAQTTELSIGLPIVICHTSPHSPHLSGRTSDGHALVSESVTQTLVNIFVS